MSIEHENDGIGSDTNERSAKARLTAWATTCALDTRWSALAMSYAAYMSPAALTEDAAAGFYLLAAATADGRSFALAPEGFFGAAAAYLDPHGGSAGTDHYDTVALWADMAAAAASDGAVATATLLAAEARDMALCAYGSATSPAQADEARAARAAFYARADANFAAAKETFPDAVRTYVDRGVVRLTSPSAKATTVTAHVVAGNEVCIAPCDHAIVNGDRYAVMLPDHPPVPLLDVVRKLREVDPRAFDALLDVATRMSRLAGHDLHA